MPSDDVPDQEQPEIIPKPPSHPITTSLLIVSCIGTIVCIGFVWAELFGYYLLSPKVVDATMSNHDWKKKEIQNHQGPIDHYKLDFPNETKYADLEYNVRVDLHLTAKQEEEALNASPSSAPTPAPPPK